MVGSTITLQQLINAQADAQALEHIMNDAEWVVINTRLGRKVYTISTIQAIIDQYKAQADAEIVNLTDAINVALAAGAGAAGWTASLVVDGNQTQQSINLYSVKSYDMLTGGYPLNARVRLANGDIVRSMVANNTANPNSDMTGWHLDAFNLESIHQSAATSLGNAIKQLIDGYTVSFAFEGDSITYGQDTTASGVAGSQINGATQTRSTKQFPEAFAQALNLVYPNSIVVNRGFPGDSTVQGLSRWANAVPVTVCFLMYGHNDANNYGGNGVVSVPDYISNMHKLIDRRLAQRSAVVVLGPPIVKDTAQNTRIRPYAEVARKIALERSLPFIDLQEIINWLSATSYGLWTDGVHLTSQAYNEIGWHLTSIFSNAKGLVQNRITEYTKCYAQSGFLVGGDQTYTSANSKTGRYIKVAPNAVITISGYFENDVIPLLSLANPEGSSNTQLSFYYSGAYPYGSQAYIFSGTNNSFSQQFELRTIPKGYRTLTFRNDGTVNAYIDSVKFKKANASLVVPTNATGIWRKSQLSGLSTDAVSAGQWCAYADNDNYLTGNWKIIADLTLVQGDTDTKHGITLLANREYSGSYLSNNQIMFVRGSSNLVVRQFVNNSASDTNFTSVFPATGKWLGEMVIEYSKASNNITIKIDGSLVATINSPSFIAGSLGLISEAASKVKCSGLTLYTDMPK